jgi:hypothetical protein
MSTKKKGVLTTSGEWARHLRAWGKRAFWRKERRASKKGVHQELRAR